MNLEHIQPDHSSLRTLLHELSSASNALDAAFKSEEDREDRVQEARAALEAFQLLERTPGPFTVPRKVSRRVAWAISELDVGKLELADSDIRWAGDVFEKSLLEFFRRQEGRH